jgi:hypothetical protein
MLASLVGRPGYTGNPRCCPKMPQALKEALQAHSADVFLDRAWGRPVQAVEDVTPAQRAIV